MNKFKVLSIIFTVGLLSACSSTNYPPKGGSSSHTSKQSIRNYKQINGTLNNSQKREISMVAFSMLDIKYNWGGKRPDFGLDCSGLVTNVYHKAIGMKVTGAARHMAQRGTDIPITHYHRKVLEPGDLLFFNTTGKSFSHVGIYVGEGKFLHASSGRGKVLVSKTDNPYYKKRIQRVRRM